MSDSGFGGSRRAAEARGDEVSQASASVRARVLRVKTFEAANGADLEAAMREWFVDKTLNSEREIVDVQYRVEGGTHYVLLLFAV